MTSPSHLWSRCVFTSTLLLTLALGAGGCDDDGEATPSDALDTASDLAEDTAPSDTSDTSDTQDATEVSDAADTHVGADTHDATDGSDTRDAADTQDGVDMHDVTDASDTRDADVDTADPDTTDASVPPGIPYRYVRITDLSPTDGSLTGGADIDAIILDKMDGTRFFAATIEGFSYGGGQVEGPDLDSANAIGAPDSFVDYTADDPVCDLDNGYISLGGTGGYLIMGMGGIIESGDTLTVLEVGGCTGNAGSAGLSEEIQVQVAISFDLDAQWIAVSQGQGPALEGTVPTLPVIMP